MARPTAGHDSDAPTARAALTHRVETVRMFEQLGEGALHLARVAEGDQRPRTIRQQVDRVAVSRRHHRPTGGQGERERPGHRLFGLVVGRHEDVGGFEEPGDLADVEKAVVQDHVVDNAELLDETLQRQPITLPVAPGDLGVGLAGDHEQDLRELRHQLGDRLDRDLDAFAWRQQPERRHHEAVGAVAPARRRLALQGHRPRDVAASDVADLGRRAMRYDVDTVGVGDAGRDHQIAGRLREHQHRGGRRTQRGQYASLALRWACKHRVQRDGIRHGELASERQHVLPVAASVDAELVLDHDDVDPQPSDQPRGAAVVGAGPAGDRGHDRGGVALHLLVVDGDDLDIRHAGSGAERSMQIGREGGDPASARGKRGQDGDAQCSSSSGESPYPPVRYGIRGRPSIDLW